MTEDALFLTQRVDKQFFRGVEPGIIDLSLHKDDVANKFGKEKDEIIELFLQAFCEWSTGYCDGYQANRIKRFQGLEDESDIALAISGRVVQDRSVNQAKHSRGNSRISPAQCIPLLIVEIVLIVFLVLSAKRDVIDLHSVL